MLVLSFKKLSAFFSALLLLTALLIQSAQAQVMIPAAPQLSATAWILIDANSGKVITEHNADQRIPPASLTKMMTSYLLEYELKQGNVALDDMVRISVKAWRTPGSRMFIREGTYVSISDLLRGVIIQSGNDASVAVAEHLAGSEESFADIMNQHASAMGMKNTQFRNATGLPEDQHYSSARDLALLSQVKILDYPEHYAIYSEREFTYNNITQSNRNRLLWRDNTVDGLKTGHTDDAGYCLAASAEREGMRLISVVMGARSDEGRAQESQKLLTYGFRYFETTRLYKQYQVLDTAKIWKGANSSVQLGLTEDLYATLPRGYESNLKADIQINPNIKAPINAGEILGNLVISLGDEVITQKPLVALENIEKAGFFKRLWHSLVIFFIGLFS
ncbi:MAG TPA: D-alanyl-D-alanine carboxypeptidase family protein [Marinospirillum sp.]|uniref:D-alanyl-D-alanine carboxypeptidase family protein n=1 Tax=Marinospirillum sp. TaxID=2183934 RepID=UPI002B491D9A|nr:D-alanyl-D-alanine carboxypeptidase family protein [Marinospirillum sp.]HKM14972.1 D-alanyl-D-alanine carboxypeptidase family protein [Marinospirillum sp.]